MRVLAAMSGGVDSAVAAARAVDAGHDVTGVHLALSSNPRSFRSGARGCCTLEDARDARRAADVIGIPFYVWDMAERFRADVVDDFVSEYSAGRTPNPCLRCNEKIKFSAVLDKARALGFDAVCTGHYARVVDALLHRAVDLAKDQSYVLGVLTPRQLAGAMFPLGGSYKQDVRREAAERGLAVAEKPDSHDICFIADGDTQGFLAQRLGSTPGPVVDNEGRTVGTHDGAYAFTVGQRRGLRIGRPATDGKPRYVLDISPVTNTVTVGPAERLDVRQLVGTRPRWCGPAPEGPTECLAQVRAHAEPVAAVVTFPAERDEVRVSLHDALRGVAPGQAVVLYDGDRVIGSATIASTAAWGSFRYGPALPLRYGVAVADPQPAERGWLELVVRRATENVAAGGGPFAALVVRGDEVVAEGVNRVTRDLDPTAHAEVVAIRTACRELADFMLTGCVLVSSCEPCPLCLSAALWARVDGVVYAADRDDAAGAGFDDRAFYDLFETPRVDWTVPVRHQRVPESTEPFEAWLAKPDRVSY